MDLKNKPQKDFTIQEIIQRVSEKTSKYVRLREETGDAQRALLSSLEWCNSNGKCYVDIEKHIDSPEVVASQALDQLYSSLGKQLFAPVGMEKKVTVAIKPRPDDYSDIPF